MYLLCKLMLRKEIKKKKQKRTVVVLFYANTVQVARSIQPEAWLKGRICYDLNYNTSMVCRSCSTETMKEIAFVKCCPIRGSMSLCACAFVSLFVCVKKMHSGCFITL